MAEVIGMTAEAINAITNALVQTGEVQDDGTIVLITLNGTRLPIGNISVDPTLAQIANLTPAADDMIQQKAGVWTNRTMAQVLADLGNDINTIENLVPANNDFLQRKAGVWANRTVAQVMTDLGTDPHSIQTVLKTATTNRTATSVIDDPDIKMTLDPNSTYDFSFECSYGGAVAMVWSWTVPTGYSGFHCDVFNLAGTGNGCYTATWNPATTYTAGAITPGLMSRGYLTLGATGGNFAFKWGSATAGQTVSLGTSILRMRKISP
jgi:hypothetical protein